MSNLSFKRWLLEQIQAVLAKPMAPAPFILWCDPQREWKELLQMAGLLTADVLAGKDEDKAIADRAA